MKYTIAAILAVAIALLVWVAQTGTGTDVAVMAVSIVTVTFFASLGNLWNSMYQKSKKERVVDLSKATVIRSTTAAPGPGDGPTAKQS